jgi:nicotinate-nucleotide--dimethylbenzimidazole phosphoribosyltransferase
MLRTLGAIPYLDLGMRLGEGTGAALMLSLIDAAVRLYTEMATFEQAGVAGANRELA